MTKTYLQIIILILIIVVTNVIVFSKDASISKGVSKNGDVSKQIKDDNWEYIKKQLFIEGEPRSVYKIDGPILFELNEATKQDSLAVNETIEELKALLPHKEICYLKDLTGEVVRADLFKDENLYKKANGFFYHQLSSSVIQLNFYRRTHKDRVFEPTIKTVLSDSSMIERTNREKTLRFVKVPDVTWLDFKKGISYKKRKQYIYYEILKKLCYVYPKGPPIIRHDAFGVYYTGTYHPEGLKFNDKDKFLLKKLYADDFSEQFKNYLYDAYSWRYASKYLNKQRHENKALGIVIILGLIILALLFDLFQNRRFKYSFLNYFLPILFGTLCFLNLMFLYTYLVYFNHGMSEKVEFKEVLIFVVSSVIISFSLWLMEKIGIKENKSFGFQLTSKIIFTLIALNLPFLIVIIGSDREVVEFIPVYIISLVLAFGRGLFIYLNYISDALVKEKDVELSLLKAVNAQSELKLLQSHINPHFLYNALNSIAGLAHNNPDKTEKMALSLSNLFRYSIHKKGQKMSTVEEEVLMVQNYLEIEKIRFGERLKFTTDIGEALAEKEIPMYILQPLVENAIKHGVSKIRGEGRITLEIKKVSELLLIIVSDNGPDFPKGLVSGHGLQTVYDLLRLSYGNKASLKWENTPKKQITISIELAV